MTKPIYEHFECRTGLSPMQQEALTYLCMVDESEQDDTEVEERGLHTILENAIKQNGCTVRTPTLMFLTLCVYGNPGFANTLAFSLAHKAYARRQTHIDKDVVVDAFALGFPSREQYAEYWGIYKDGAADANRNNLEDAFRPCLMLNALREASVDFSNFTHEKVVAAYLELDEPAGDESYALPA